MNPKMKQMNQKLNLQLKDNKFDIIAWSYFELHKRYDEKTAMHEYRVAKLAMEVASKITNNKEVIKNIYYAGLLHDLGKIFVPLSILKNNNYISDNEMNIIREHSKKGAELLKELGFNKFIVRAVKQHHERLDGSGYPEGLMNEQILMEGRIIAACDSYDAMSSARPYRKEVYSDDIIFEKLLSKNRVLYDPHIINIMEEIVKDDKKVSYI